MRTFDDEVNLRPIEVLANVAARYGLSKAKTANIGGDNRPAITYALLAHPTDDPEKWEPRWHLVGVSTDALSKKKDQDAIAEGYGKIHEMILAQPFRDVAPQPLAMVLVTHGEAEIAVGDAETGKIVTVEELPDEYKAVMESVFGEKYADRVKGGAVPARAVAVITPEGIAVETAFGFPDSDDPVFSVAEQWIDEPGDEFPDAPGTDALTKAFGLLIMLRGAVDEGHEPSLNGVMKYAKELVAEGAPGAKAMLAFLLRLVATGMETGKIELGDDNDDPGSIGGIFD